MVSTEVQKLVVSDAQRAIDLEMVPYDLWGTQAHVLMLEKTGIMPTESAQAVLSALATLEEQVEQGTFEIDPTRGAQLTLEKEIVALAGETAGLATHTARSRNDQVMVTETLFVRDKALALHKGVSDICNALIDLAAKHPSTVMPGYTHMQPGKPTTFAQWCLAYADSFQRGLDSLEHVITQFDQCPLGAVESFGTSWPIDRERTQKLLGFERVWEIPQDAISHRGLFQVMLLSAFNQLSLSFSKIATDLMLYSTFEFQFIAFGDAVAQRLHPITGSSVMAQKKNPDALELIRAVAPQMAGLYQSALSVLTGLPTGYNRDSREVKEYIVPAFTKLNAAAAALEQVVSTLQVNNDRMREVAEQNYSLTTDLADFVAQETGKPYRLIYKIVGRAVDKYMEAGKPLNELTIEEINAEANEFDTVIELSSEDFQSAIQIDTALAKRKHIGGSDPQAVPGHVESRKQNLRAHANWRTAFQEKILAAREETRALAAGVTNT